MVRYYRYFILNALLLGIIGCTDTSPPLKKDIASVTSKGLTPAEVSAIQTNQYWTSAREIVRKSELTKNLITRKSGSPAGAISACNKAANLGDEIAGDLAGLPLLDVDQDAIKYLADYSTHLREEASLYRDFASWAKEAGAFEQNAKSLGTFFESFARGALGDPLGVVLRIESGQEGIEKKKHQLLGLAQKSEARGIVLAKEEVALRSRLAAKYKQEFIPLESPVPQAAREFSDFEVRQARQRVNQQLQEIGWLLLNGTHPTGQYESTTLSAFEVSQDFREMVIKVQCSWKGATSSRYQTVYLFEVSKSKGVTDLRVVTDTALFKIKESNREQARGQLHEYWDQKK
ncbi:MAG: hypothetical protein EXS09_20415 [Gemmataceae bacterium]|nr:hypothetical protein [Gemmataceae bacterium]